jgi:hypothetical protein
MSNEASGIELSPLARVAAWVAMVGAAVALVALGLLHALSPEYDPAWRMVSEYANGTYGWVLSLMFAVWGISSWALVIGIWRQEKKALFRIGLVFLLAAGLGEAMAAVFDINQPLHDLASVLGIVGVPVGAILITTTLCRDAAWSAAKKPLKLSAHLTWVSVLLFAVSFGVMVLTFQLSGNKMDPAAGPTPHAPAGVIGYVGWTDRLFVVVSCAWVAVVARLAMKLSERRVSG